MEAVTLLSQETLNDDLTTDHSGCWAQCKYIKTEGPPALVVCHCDDTVILKDRPPGMFATPIYCQSFSHNHVYRDLTVMATC